MLNHGLWSQIPKHIHALKSMETVFSSPKEVSVLYQRDTRDILQHNHSKPMRTIFCIAEQGLVKILWTITTKLSRERTLLGLLRKKNIIWFAAALRNSGSGGLSYSTRCCMGMGWSCVSLEENQTLWCSCLRILVSLKTIVYLSLCLWSSLSPFNGRCYFNLSIGIFMFPWNSAPSMDLLKPLVEQKTDGSCP